MPVLRKLRKLANGKMCQVRVPGVCNADPMTTVLAHLNGGGMGMKHEDIFGAWCCSACHDLIDGRKKSEYSNNELRLFHLEGIIRTQRWLIKNSHIYSE